MKKIDKLGRKIRKVKLPAKPPDSFTVKECKRAAKQVVAQLHPMGFSANLEELLNNMSKVECAAFVYIKKGETQATMNYVGKTFRAIGLVEVLKHWILHGDEEP